MIATLITLENKYGTCHVPDCSIDSTKNMRLGVYNWMNIKKYNKESVRFEFESYDTHIQTKMLVGKNLLYCLWVILIMGPVTTKDVKNGSYTKRRVLISSSPKPRDMGRMAVLNGFAKSETNRNKLIGLGNIC